MTFIEVLKKTNDYTLAEGIFTEIHGNSFNKDWSFDQWLEVVENSDSYNSERLARTELLARAKSYKQLRTTLQKTAYFTCNIEEEDKPKRTEIMDSIFLSISDFEEVISFWNFVCRGLMAETWSEKFRLAILERASKLAKSFKDWDWILEHSWDHPKQTILEKMLEKAKTFDDWLELYKVSNGHEEIHGNAFQKLVSLSKNGIKK